MREPDSLDDIYSIRHTSVEAAFSDDLPRCVKRAQN